MAKVPNVAVNLAASLVAAGRASELLATLKKFVVSPKASFELAFNVACACV